MRVIIKGVTKYEFLNAMDNPIYSFKKWQLLIYQLMIKFKIIYSIIPESTLKQINDKFSHIYDKKQFEKSPEAL